jgi:hypothetical protein
VKLALVPVLVVALGAPASAQPDGSSTTLTPVQADVNTCNKNEQQQQPLSNEAAVALKYFDFEIHGDLIDSSQARALMEPTTAGGRVLSEGHRKEISTPRRATRSSRSARRMSAARRSRSSTAPRDRRKVDIAVQPSVFDTLIDDQVKGTRGSASDRICRGSPSTVRARCSRKRRSDFLRSQVLRAAVKIDPSIEKSRSGSRCRSRSDPNSSRATCDREHRAARDRRRRSQPVRAQKCVFKVVLRDRAIHPPAARGGQEEVVKLFRSAATRR